MSRQDFSPMTGSDPSYIDSLYEKYKQEPDSLEESWKMFFQGFEFHKGGDKVVGEEMLRAEFNVFRMIQSYRSRGHLLSDTNPIRPRRDRDARIDIKYYDLNKDDLNKKFICGKFVGFENGATLQEIIDHMRALYCNKIGIEYTHISHTDIRRWVRNEYESTAKQIDYSLEKKKRILQKLNEANVFETFLQSKYVGQKRFSLEGGESLIPALDAIIYKGCILGAEEFIFSMGHRGRLNVLANIIGKTYEYIFSEFEGNSLEELSNVGGGDVKYHLGHTSIQEIGDSEEVILKVLPNPSHLESVAPVAQGYTRAQIDVVYKGQTNSIIPVVIHGDAAVSGQGVVYETLQMSELKSYSVGGTIHFIVNNQIGFTTDFQDGRSAHYCTSLAKMLDGPIFHVNGDEPEHVVYVCELAVKFRQEFKKDVWIDMVCYRKHGHNEGDEPKYTQPHLYGLVAKHKNPRELYIEKLLTSDPNMKKITQEVQKNYREMLIDRFNNVKQKELPKRKKGPHKGWTNLRWSNPEDFQSSPKTSVSKKVLDKVIKAIVSVPKGFKTLKKAQKILDERRDAYKNNKLDWALGELLAYGSLVLEGRNIRFSGQDVIRGTFSHRHAKLFDEYTNKAHCGLAHLEEDKDKIGSIHIYNSHLSEYAVLGFEYGYSQGNPWSLNIWEAQFGDFSNGAQIIIDQFISAGESKWRRMNSVVLLLPHGQEGAGPEHSSARPERYLQLCAEYNMIVANCTTPAQFFHILRRQMIYPFRKPLVVLTPKSLLRDSQCTSSLEEFSKGRFREIIVDSVKETNVIKQVIFCTGKIYYQLKERQLEEKRSDTALVRLEQLYPLNTKEIMKIKEMFSKARFFWIQEEPKNMGAWMHLTRWKHIFGDFECIARKAAASPATGFSSVYLREQKQLIDTVFK